MVKVVLMLEVGDSLLEREIDMPFAPVPGMDLMLGVSAWWNQMSFDSVMWYDDLQEMQCHMRLHDTASAGDTEVRKVLISNNWIEC